MVSRGPKTRPNCERDCTNYQHHTLYASFLNPSGKGIGVLFMGLAVRMCVASVVGLKSDLNLKERLFLPLAWIPKATVQAAIGAIAYDKAVKDDETDLIPKGKTVSQKKKFPSSTLLLYRTATNLY